MSPTWSPQQREWLGALGYSVLVTFAAGDDVLADELPGATSPVAPSSTEAPRDVPPADRGARLGIPAPKPMRPIKVELDPTLDAPSAPPAGPVRVDLSNPLYRALLRATAQRTAREGQAMLDALAVDTDVLRDDPRSKRMLWQALRTARKAKRG